MIKDCVKTNPIERPTFLELRKRFGDVHVPRDPGPEKYLPGNRFQPKAGGVVSRLAAAVEKRA